MTDPKCRIARTLDAMSGELFELSLRIHDAPELSFNEHKASAWQKALLEKYGFSVEMPYAGLDTAFRATYRGGKKGPSIAYLSEYDALEGIGHGCGHNLMALIGCAGGIALREFVDEFGGTVYVYGTPAEETVGGKCIMAERGAFDGLDAALIAHPGEAFKSSGSTTAASGFRFEFFGRPAHSAGNPEMGINALDAAVNTFNMVNALRQHVRSDSRIHGIIEHGGDAANIVPKYASILMEVRSPDREYYKELCERVFNCARAAALGAGARVEIASYEQYYDVLTTNSVLSGLYDEQLRAFGITDIQPGKLDFGSTDMGNVSQRCPAIHPYFGITGGASMPWHTKEVALLTGTQSALDSALITAKALALTGARLLMEPGYLERAWDEFRSAKR